MENLKPKYNCFQRAQRLRECEGQALYLADRVDGMVLEAVRELARQAQDCYQQFCGWAEEFELAPLARKRVILSQLLDRVELGKGYQVTLHLKLTYRQFLDLTGQEKAAQITQTKMEHKNIA